MQKPLKISPKKKITWLAIGTPKKERLETLGGGKNSNKESYGGPSPNL